MCGQQAYCFPVPLISIADKVFWSKKNFRILPISLFRAPPHFDIPSYGSSQQFGHWPLAILSSRLMTQITLMTAAILPISPFWQLRDKAVTTVTYNPQRLDLSYMRGLGSSPYMRVWDWIPWWYRWWQQWPTSWPSVLTEDSSGSGSVDKEMPDGAFYLSRCPAGREISDGKEISRDLFHVRKRRRGNIRLRTGIQRPQRPASDHKADPFQRLYTYTHTRVYTCIRIHTDAFQSPTGTCSIYGISLFLTNLLIHSAWSLLKQTNK